MPSLLRGCAQRLPGLHGEIAGWLRRLLPNLPANHDRVVILFFSGSPPERKGVLKKRECRGHGDREREKEGGRGRVRIGQAEGYTMEERGHSPPPYPSPPHSPQRGPVIMEVEGRTSRGPVQSLTVDDPRILSLSRRKYTSFF